MNMKRLNLFIFGALLATAQAERIEILSWNTESGGSNSSVIATQLAELNTGHKYSIIGLTEVASNAVEQYRAAAGESYEAVVTQSGGEDRMVILIDTDKLESLGSLEMHDYQGEPLNWRSGRQWRFRSPLVIHTRSRQDGTEALYMVNHLARGQDDLRTKQAKTLRKWGADQTLPVVALGDFNFDYLIPQDHGNEGYNEMIRDGVWKWIRPNPLIDTNWADNHGQDSFPDTILDFIFTAGGAHDWSASSKVIVRDGDFPDNRDTSDHRPISGVLDTAAQPSPRRLAEGLGFSAVARSITSPALKTLAPAEAPSSTSSDILAKKRTVILKKIELLKAELDLLQIDEQIGAAKGE